MKESVEEKIMSEAREKPSRQISCHRFSIREAIGWIPTSCEVCGDYYDPQYSFEMYVDVDKERQKDHPPFWFVCEKCAKKYAPELYAVWLQIRQRHVDLEPGKPYLFPPRNNILAENDNAQVLEVPKDWPDNSRMWIQDITHKQEDSEDNPAYTVGGFAFLNEDGKVFRRKSSSYGEGIFDTKKEFLDFIKKLPMVPAELLPQAEPPLSGDTLVVDDGMPF